MLSTFWFNLRFRALHYILDVIAALRDPASRRTAGVLAILNFISFLLVTVNFRAVAQGRYLLTFVTDITLCLLGFTIFKRLQAAEKNRAQALAYAIAGAVAAQLGIFLT